MVLLSLSSEDLVDLVFGIGAAVFGIGLAVSVHHLNQQCERSEATDKVGPDCEHLAVWCDEVAGSKVRSLEVVGVRPPTIFTTGEPDEGRNLTGGGL